MQASGALMTISETVSFEVIIKRSRFLAFIEPATTKEQAQQILERYRSTHWDAEHHCYAWRLGDQGMQYRMSDDGEPSGSAGKPILFAIQRASITNVVVVVVRYFGGVKLGIGPLARAYAEATTGAVSCSTTVPIVVYDRFAIHCIYDDVSKVIPLLQEVGAEFETQYSDAVRFDVRVPVSKADFLKTEVLSRTNARAGYSKIAADGE